MKLRVYSSRNRSGDIMDMEEAREWDYYDPAALVVVENELVRSYNELLAVASRPGTRDKELLDVHLMITLTGG
ncbi:MAG: hypothetical protein HY673_21330 [Chloroflexi bacterium]|nr:hypothetical protein [Chloroflexota bacterium]